MPTIPSQLLQEYRRKTFRLNPGTQLTSVQEAIQFVEERGFIFFWPSKDFLLPSLWTAVAGDRPVADEHDDPGHVSWGWKDEQLNQKSWYYARVIRKRNALVSLSLAPYFYALTHNYGSPESDYLDQYQSGKMTLEARQVYEALLREGPLDSIELRRQARLTSKESDSRFNKALTDLQMDFKILPIGVADAGSWHYAFIYAITALYYPQIPEQARHISEKSARMELAKRYLASVGAIRPNDLSRLFGWEPAVAESIAKELVIQNFALPEYQIENTSSFWHVYTGLIHPQVP